MEAIYIIVKNERGNPKIPVRWGIQGGGEWGYCLHSGRVVCFCSFEEADRTLATFTDPHFYDIVEYRKRETVNDERRP